MKPITFKPLQKPTSTARTAKEALIEEIVAATDAKGKKVDELKKLLAIAANTLKWTEMDLHALLKKKNDPSIRNYSAFVRWQTKQTQVHK